MSSLLNEFGACEKICQRWRKGQFSVLISSPVLEEYTEVLRNAQSISYEKVTILLNDIKAFSNILEISGKLCACKDADDDKFLETAVIGRADYLVTKNLKHFPRKSYGNVRIVSVSEFLKELEKKFPANNM